MENNFSPRQVQPKLIKFLQRNSLFEDTAMGDMRKIKDNPPRDIYFSIRVALQVNKFHSNAELAHASSKEKGAEQNKNIALRTL